MLILPPPPTAGQQRHRQSTYLAVREFLLRWEFFCVSSFMRVLARYTGGAATWCRPAVAERQEINYFAAPAVTQISLLVPMRLPRCEINYPAQREAIGCQQNCSVKMYVRTCLVFATTPKIIHWIYVVDTVGFLLEYIGCLRFSFYCDENYTSGAGRSALWYRGAANQKFFDRADALCYASQRV